MKFLCAYRVSECPFAPHWDWQMDQEEFLDLVKGLHTSSVPWDSNDHSLATEFCHSINSAKNSVCNNMSRSLMDN